MRQPVLGTIPRGELGADAVYYKGRDANGEWVEKAPVDVALPLLQRGRERYDIYCSPCHSRIGDGKGIMVERGYVPPPSFHQERMRELADGYVFDVITHGIRNMPGYAHQIPTEDRWAVVAYMRALQRSQNAAAGDVLVQMQEKLK
jgi:mono/diheme cytochrome c family protein